MANRNETATSTVLMDGKQAEAELQKLDIRAKELRASLIELGKANDKAGFDRAEKELKLVNREMNSYKKATFDVTKVLNNLSGATYKDLQKAQRQITAELNKMTRGTEEYIAASKKLKSVTAEIDKVKTEMYGLSDGKRGFGGIAESFNKYATMGMAFAASITGVVLGFKSAVQAYDDYEQKVANLSALTGLQGEDLNWLSEQAKVLSTSMTVEGVRINKSADDIVDAFTKMGSAKPELLKDKEALLEVSKAALVLAASTSDMPLDDAVQALANTMNQFNAPASEAARYINVLGAGAKEGAKEVPYISEAITKFGAAAAAFNVPIEQSVAMIEALGEKGLQAEVAGTGIRRVLLNLATGADDTNPKIVGLQVALNNLAKQNLTANQMMEKFGMEGYIAAQSLIANAGRVDALTKAITGTNVAYEQAIINTDTDKTKKEQAKNVMHLTAIALGKELAPAMTFSTNAVSYLMKGTLGLIKVFKEYGGLIVSAGITIAAYSVATNLAAIKTFLFDAAVKVSTISMRILNTVLKQNPLVLFGSIVAGVAAYFLFLRKNVDATAKAVDVLSKAKERSQSLFQEEKTSLDVLFGMLKKTNAGTKERQGLIDKINERYGTTLQNLSDEKKFIEQIDTAYADLITKIKEKAFIQAKEEELTAIYKQQSVYLNGIKDAKNKLYKEEEINGKKVQVMNGSLAKFEVDRLQNSIKLNEAMSEAEQKKIDKLLDFSDEEKKIIAEDKEPEHTEEKIEKQKKLNDKVKEGVSLFEKVNDILNKYKNQDDFHKGMLTISKDFDGLILQLEVLEKMFPALTGISKGLKDARTSAQNELKAGTLGKNTKPLQDKLMGKADARMQVGGALMSDEDREKAQVEKHYDDLIKLAKKYGIETTGLEAKRTKEIAKINAESDQAILAAKISIANSSSDIIGSIMDVMSKKGQENTIFYKALALAQIGINLGISISNAMASVKSVTAVGYAIKMATIIASVIAAMASAYMALDSAPIPQAAKGRRMNVIGEDDGQNYNLDYAGAASTGLVTRPLIVGERGNEIILDNPTTQRLMVNSPEAVNAIRMARDGVTPGRKSQTTTVVFTDPVLTKLMSKLDKKIDNIEARIVYTPFKKEMDKIDRIKQSVTV